MKKILLFAFIAALFVCPLSSMELPKVPTGFTWQEIPELKAAFLKPERWFFKQESSKGTNAYFITKEDINKTGQFNTGLTVNVFRLKHESAVERGKSLIEGMATQHNVKTSSRVFGPFQEFSCELRDTDANGTILMYALTVANPKTNTLYLFVFESPESSWDAEWKLGKQILDTLALDDEI